MRRLQRENEQLAREVDEQLAVNKRLMDQERAVAGGVEKLLAEQARYYFILNVDLCIILTWAWLCCRNA